MVEKKLNHFIAISRLVDPRLRRIDRIATLL